MKEDLVKDIKNAVINSEQTDIFGSKNDTLEEACSRYLMFKGYRVVSPKKFNYTIKKLDDLIHYFYSLHNNKHPEKFASSMDLGRDRATAKELVEARMIATGVGREYALNECGEIIKTIIDNEDKFKFKYNLSFSVFDQKKLKWIIDSAVQIINKDFTLKEEDKAKILRRKAIELEDDEELGFEDLDELVAKLEEE